MARRSESGRWVEGDDPQDDDEKKAPKADLIDTLTLGDGGKRQEKPKETETTQSDQDSDSAQAEPREPEETRRPERPEKTPEMPSAQEILEQFPAPIREKVERYLNSRDGEWFLEQRRHTFLRLLNKREVHRGGTAVQVEQQWTLTQDVEPGRDEVTPALEHALDESPDLVEENLEAVQASLSENDEVRLRWETSEGPKEAVITAKAIEISEPETAVEPQESGYLPLIVTPEIPSAPRAESPDRELAPGEVIDLGPPRSDESQEVSVPTPEVPVPTPEANLSPEVTQLIEETADIELDPADVATAEATITDIWESISEDPEEVSSVLASELPRSPRSRHSRHSHSADSESEDLIDEEIEETVEEPPPKSEPPPTASDDEDKKKSSTRIHGGGGGGYTSPDANRSRHHDPERPHVHLSHRGEFATSYERTWSEPQEAVSFRMHEAAKRFVRFLAHHYGVRMTPKLEAYLLEIALRPHHFGGRKVYSLGLNRETLMQAISGIALNYGGKFGG